MGTALSSKEAKKIAKREKKNRGVIIREDKLENAMGGRGGRKNDDHYRLDEQTFRTDLQKELLCTGNTFRVLYLENTNVWLLADFRDIFFQSFNETKDLKCFFAHADSPWLRLGPMKIELQSKDPYMAVIRELMFPHECDGITRFLGPYLGPPPGRMKGGKAGKNDWTMKK